MKELSVFNIQRFCHQDGKGLRTVIFLSGCPLNCKWCHNPEGKKIESQLLFYPNKCMNCQSCATYSCHVHQFSKGNHFVDYKKCNSCNQCVFSCPANALELTNKKMTIDEIIQVALKDYSFYGDDGGITLSGGEPTMQIDGLLELLKKAKEYKMNVAMETCGYFPEHYLLQFVNYVDTFLWDVKDCQKERHLNNTGVDNQIILSNLKKADQLNFKIRLRCILLHGINCNQEHANFLLQLAKSLKNIEGIDLISYHPEGKNKYSFLGLENNFDHSSYIPTIEDIALFKATLKEYIK